MARSDHALDILIEDLAMQLLSARLAAGHAELLQSRLADALAVQAGARAGKLRPSADPLEVQRALTGMAGRAGLRVQETASLARTLEWNLRFYLARRDAGRKTAGHQTNKRPPAGRKASGRKTRGER